MVLKKLTKKRTNKVILTEKEFYKLEFPYRDLYTSKSQLLRDFNSLRKFKPKLIKLKFTPNFQKRNIVFYEDYEKYKHLYMITDYFSQRCRVKCIFNIVEKESVLDLFKSRREKIYQDLQKKKLDITYENIREEIFLNFKQCTNFNVTLVMSILQIFKPKRWLDFSAGWGDRLIGALAYGCEYTGVDPSKCLQPIYRDIIKTLSKKGNQKKYKIITDGFENVSLPTEWYDLVFTSPPFFDFEIYGTGKKQSTEKFKTVKMWKEKFLFPSIRKSIATLRTGGYLALYITDYRDKKYIDDMLEFIRVQLPNTEYCGNLYWVNKGKLGNKRIVYVFSKKDKKILGFKK